MFYAAYFFAFICIFLLDGSPIGTCFVAKPGRQFVVVALFVVVYIRKAEFESMELYYSWFYPQLDVVSYHTIETNETPIEFYSAMETEGTFSEAGANLGVHFFKPIEVFYIPTIWKHQ